MKWYLTPPPSLSGDDKKDLKNLYNYVFDLHNAVSMLANNNIDEDNFTDVLKNKLLMIDKNTDTLNKILK